MKLPIWASMFLNKALVLANCYNMVALFSAMVEKCSYTYKKLFCFLTSFKVKGFPLIPYDPHLLKHYQNLLRGFTTNFFNFINKNTHVSSHFYSDVTNYPMHHKKDIHDDHYLNIRLQYCHLCIFL
jgi:hypothetical protein